jgi:hypothetical protein
LDCPHFVIHVGLGVDQKDNVGVIKVAPCARGIARFIPEDDAFRCTETSDASCTRCYLDDSDVVFLVDTQSNMNDKMWAVQKFINGVTGGLVDGENEWEKETRFAFSEFHAMDTRSPECNSSKYDSDTHTIFGEGYTTQTQSYLNYRDFNS